MKVVVIGGGPAGMMAAISAKQAGNDVTILEKMNSCGRKLLITGKGRCNITSSLDMSEFMNNIPRNPRFLYSSFDNFNNKDIIKFIEQYGLKVKCERGNRIFPETDKSQDVLNVFVRKLRELDIKVKINTPVKRIIAENGQAIAVEILDGDIIEADKIILATGGKSYPGTGSTGDGYKFAEELGHTVIPVKPSLVPLNIYEANVCRELQGLSLKNIKIKINDENKTIYEDFGEMIFTHFGVSGPTILSSSAILLRYKEIENRLKQRKIKLLIDLKPALEMEKLDLRIRRDFEEYKNKQFKNSLDKLLPQKLIPVIIKECGIDENKRVNEITKEERARLVQKIKKLELTVQNFRPIEEAIITAGGISVKEINPRTMESKLVKGLYFAGEIIDVDAYTGGFNLQIAYSTGYTAGMNRGDIC